MGQLTASFLSIMVVPLIVLFFVSAVIWLFFDHGIDKIKHPEEWKDAGKSGERIIYLALVHNLKIPENQIFRNVYIPTEDNNTSEIDLLIVSKKGLFVLECKNYSGNIYGDTTRQKWVQYLGGQKTYFYNPLMQNKNHAKHLREFLTIYKIEVPIIPLVTTISRGKWKVKNLKSDDYILGLNCHLKDIYNRMPISKECEQNIFTIMNKLKSLSRPNNSIKRKHIEQIQSFHS